MSETRHVVGKLIKQERVNYTESLNEQCARILHVTNFDTDTDYVESLLDKYYEEYVVHNGLLYAVDMVEVDPEGDISRMRKINGNDFSFEVRYYDGGGDLQEAIEDAFSNLK